MLRPARFVDVPRLVEMLADAHGKSRYAGKVNVDAGYARKLLAQLVQRHGHTNHGGSCVFVVEGGDGAVCGLVVGILERVYMIGDQLAANDLFLVVNKNAPISAMKQLIGAYLDWADNNQNVAEINLSWTNALATGERMSKLYKRLNFTKCGEVFCRRSEPVALEMAA